MENKLQLVVKNDKIYADSRDVAEMTGKRHADLCRDIERYIGAISTNAKLRSLDFFVESSYIDKKGESRKCYLLTKKGCDMVANKMTGEKGILFTATYIDRFYQMEQQLKAGASVKLTDDERAKQMRADAMLRNAMVRQARFLKELSQQAVTASAKTILLTQAANTAAGKNILSLPRAAERATMTATDLCQHFHLADTWAGVLSKKLNKRLERNESTGYHTQTLTPAGKQVMQWNWFTDVVLPIANDLKKNGAFEGHYKK